MEVFRPIVRNPKFLYLWISQILSEFTVNTLNFILLVELFSLTGSSVASSLVYLSYALPAILVGPFASATVDIFDRRKILVVSNIFQSLVVLAFALTPHVNPFLLYSLAFTYSFLNQFYIPAQAASLPSLVRTEDLPQANGLFFLTQQASIAAGFGIGGVMTKVLGYRNSLLLSSILLLAAFVSSSLLPKMSLEKERLLSFEDSVKNFFKKIGEGYMFIKGNKSILAPFIILLSVQIGLAIIMVNVPAISRTVLNVDPSEAGITIVVPGAIGALFGAIFVPKLLHRHVRKKTILEFSYVGLFSILFLISLITPLLSGLVRSVINTTLIFFGGASITGILITVQTFLQEKTPKELYGRVFGNMWFLVTVATVLPVFFSGAISDVLGIRSLLFLLSLGMLSAFLVSKGFGQRLLENSTHDK